MRPVLPLLFALSLCACDGGKDSTTTTPTDTPTDTGPTTDPNDGDGDGFAAGDDCDDTDPSRYPGAPEHCDGIDSDCAGDDDTQLVTVLPAMASFASLAEAAATLQPGDTVEVCPGTYAGSATLSSSVTVRSFGEEPAVLDAQGAGTTVVVDAPDVVLDGLVITGGSQSGVLATLEGSMELSACEVFDNVGTNGGGVQFSVLGGRMVDSVVRDNVASNDGGGIYALGNVQIEGSTLQANVATGQGGGLTVGTEARVTVLDSTLADNRAEYGGGLFAFQRSDTELEGTTVVSDNTASSSGGGVYLWSATLDGGEVSGNDAVASGGGLYVHEGGTVSNVLLDRNAAETGGGAVLHEDVDLDTVTVEGNAATYGGGLYLLDADVVGVDVVVSGNEADDDGGGVYLQDASISGADITENTAADGAGIYIYSVDYTTAIVRDVTLQDNVAGESGGGLYVVGDTELHDSVVRRNSSADRAGGVFVNAPVEMTLEDTDVIDNTATNRGGGFYPNSGALVTMVRGQLSLNDSTRGAGAYVNNDAELTLDDVTVHNNGDPTTVTGGGVRITSGRVTSLLSDWGTDTTDNQPDDVYTELAGAYVDFGAGEIFVCDANGCS
jgi:predicted outer membrane repeat protein